MKNLKSDYLFYLILSWLAFLGMLVFGSFAMSSALMILGFDLPYGTTDFHKFVAMAVLMNGFFILLLIFHYKSSGISKAVEELQQQEKREDKDK
jgi:hypothetical protein